MNDPKGRFLPNGDVEFDFGPGSCFTCGGTVTTRHEVEPDDERPAGVVVLPVDVCVSCGRVDPVVFHRDDGSILQGFMSRAETARLPVLRDDPDAGGLF